LAGSPILRSPPSTNATTEGVVRLPSLFAITTGVFDPVLSDKKLLDGVVHQLMISRVRQVA